MLFRLLDIFFHTKKEFMGPTNVFVETCKRYGLYYVLQRAVVNGYYMPIIEWKKNVTKLILKRDERQIIMECSLYKILKYLSYEREVMSISVWWHHAQRNPKFARINRTIIRLNLNVERFGLKICQDCDMFVYRSIEHVMFECTVKEGIREKYWMVVMEVCPVQLIVAMNRMSIYERCVFILNGCNCKYITEWNNLYCAISTFVYNMFNVKV